MNAHQPYKDKYPHLFEPMVVGRKKRVIKNRVFVAPMHGSALVDCNQHFTDYGLEFYAEKARGGFGCIDLGEAMMKHKNCLAHDVQVELYTEKGLLPLHAVNELIHCYGALSQIELCHAGHFALPQMNNGEPPMGVCDFTMPDGTFVRQMTEEDMNEVADAYADAVFHAKRAMFDGVLLHYGHGWLMHSFLSPLMNKRTDKYGGSYDNCVRFPRMVLERVREKVGDDMLIELRICGSELTPGGLEVEDTIQYLRRLEDLVDMVHISSGTRMNAESRGETHPSHFVPHGHNAHLSQKVKESGFSIPIGVVGAIYDPAKAEEILANGQADYVMMARQSICDSDWVNKVREGREEDIRPCIHCIHCIDYGKRKAVSNSVQHDFTGTKKTQCSVNPLYGHSNYKTRLPAPTRVKKVVVIGGGVAGMQAAIEARTRGHIVSLYERSDKLGGQLFYTDHVWFKKDMRQFREYLITQCRKLGVNIKLNTEATPENIETERADAVIVAVGAEPIIPNIPGMDKDIVTMGLDVFGHEEKLGKQVVIIGGGMVGCEMGIHLTSLGHSATVVEMGEHLAPDAQLSERQQTLKYMRLGNVEAHTQMTCIEITDTGIICEDKDKKQVVFPADSVVVCAGMRSKAVLRDTFAESAFDVSYAGDCVNVANVRHAVHTGYDVAVVL